MEERRSIVRRRLQSHIQVYERDSEQHVGTGVNLSDQGMLVVAPRALTVGEPLALRLTLPEPLHGQESLDVDARVAWRRPDVHPGFYDQGMAFTAITARDQAIIREFIARHCILG